jgi:hypothetical protein
MLVGYSGKIINGQPALLEATSLPENANIIIMVELPPKSDVDAHAFDHRSVALKFLTIMQSLRKELTTEDEDALVSLQNGKYKPQYDRRLES